MVSFRLVYDKETGKPKGFGFLEYTDVDAAASAVRNLNGQDIMGRTLKVDYSNDNTGGQRNNQQDHPQGGSLNVNLPGNQANGSSDLPPLPPGTDLPPGLTAPDAISQTLQKIPPPQLLDFISQLKTFVSADPAKASTLLNSAPQLSYATFQALLLLGLVDTSIIGSLIQHTMPQAVQQPPQAQAPPPQAAPVPFPPQPGMPPLPAGYGQPQFGVPPPAQFQQPFGHTGYNPTPPVPAAAYQPPQPAQPQPPPQQAPPAASADQAALIQQLMAMTREQIYAQDEATRNTILQLRAQYGAPVS